MKLSVILPLIDMRDALHLPLTSLLKQSFDRDRYEIVAVVPQSSRAAFYDDAQYADALKQCDQTIFVDLDPDVAENEICFYSEGCSKATGDLLYFVEGHTEILPDACRILYDHFSSNPECQAAWALRINHNDNPIGKLIGIHNDYHEGLAKKTGWFTLGGNSVIRKTLFEELDGFDPAFGRYNESVFFDKLAERNINVDLIESEVCIHYNDMTVSHLVELARAMGKSKCTYFASRIRDGADIRELVRHKIYLLMNNKAAATCSYPLCRALGSVLLHLARISYRIHIRTAYTLYVLGLGFSDLTGYTRQLIASRNETSKVNATPVATTSTYVVDSFTHCSAFSNEREARIETN